MYVLGPLFDRGRKARLMQNVLKAPSEAAALEEIGNEFNGPLMELTTPAERAQLYHWILAVLRRDPPVVPALHRDDVLGGVAVALLIVVATFPIVLPYLVVSDPHLAVRISHLIALTLLSLLGVWWGRVVGGRIAAGPTLVGLTLVLVTIALGR
jgi:VIT1/CCC1 family predicted Fe2+/Mn2+ transporter